MLENYKAVGVHVSMQRINEEKIRQLKLAKTTSQPAAPSETLTAGVPEQNH
jgi:hypothetical protein